MQYCTSLCLFLGLQAATAAAVPVVQPREEGGIEGYRTEPLVWEVPVYPGGENKTIAGTAEEVHAELLRRNPQWDTDFPLEVGAGSLESRADFEPESIVCSPKQFGWRPASANTIKDGISYLRGVHGRPRQGPGPGSCGRVSCSWKAAIWWCNDDEHTKTIDSFGSIADAAQKIVDKCIIQRGIHGETAIVLGQAFHSDNWNVIVRHDGC